MPHHPAEETAPDNIFDKVAQESSDSTASDHPLHDENKGPVKATAEDHNSKGPAIPDKMPGASSKEELKARAADLNK